MTKNHTINFGPQHPAAHGVLRLVMELDGEVVVDVKPHIGLLHRGTEKLMEHKMYNQNIGYMDRLDYVSMLCNEHAYVLSIEKMLKLEVPVRASYIRVMFDEITRILNHLLWLGATALDIGAMSIFLYCFKQRETLMDCYEAVSGARMHANYYRPGGVLRDLPKVMPKYANDNKWRQQNKCRNGSLLDYIQAFVDQFPKKLQEIEDLLSENQIWQMRTVNIGIVAKQDAINWGFSGPMLRASGVNYDIRKQEPYSVYPHLKFKVPVGHTGDCYDRYQVRVAEMYQSCSIVQQCVNWLSANPGEVLNRDHKVNPPHPDATKSNMEALIHHFKHFSEGYCIPLGHTYQKVEAPKGEFGIFLVSDGANKPYRVKIRAPGFAHLAAFKHMAKGHLLADAVAILASQDIVLGEIDR